MTTKKQFHLSSIILLIVLIAAMLITPALAIEASEVEALVDSEGKDVVTGNVLIWFLCAVAFLKVSQKVDSFMASLGVNVGHTGGSLLGEAMIVARGISTIAGAAGHTLGSINGHRNVPGTSSSKSPPSGNSSTTGFFKGGLAGMVSRKVASDAVKSATSTSTVTSASHSAKRSASVQHSSLGASIYKKSVAAGGAFANDVIGTVARGDIRSTGTISGDSASQALMSYMGFTALGEQATDVPAFSNVEIGGGRITGIETPPCSSEGTAFGMYQADQYAAPQGDYATVHSADGACWYKQYAQDSVERKPYMAPDDTVAYHESIIKKLPDPPKRKDRM